MSTEEILGAAVGRLVDEFRPQRVLLFGSRARGTADDRSDFDILVVCEFAGARRPLMIAANRTLRGLEAAFGVVFLTPEEFDRDRNIPGTIARPAWLEGKVVYERR
jgi:predicted nucleotidyltransferase